MFEWECFHCVFNILEFDVDFWPLRECKIDGRPFLGNHFKWNAIFGGIRCRFAIGRMKQCVVVGNFNIFLDEINNRIFRCGRWGLTTPNDGWCGRFFIFCFSWHDFETAGYHLVLKFTRILLLFLLLLLRAQNDFSTACNFQFILMRLHQVMMNLVSGRTEDHKIYESNKFK